MPRKLQTAEEIQASWERTRVRNREAQRRWVENNKDVHLERMKEQYAKKKETKAKEEEEEVKPRKRKLQTLVI